MSPLQWTSREVETTKNQHARSSHLSYGQVEALEKLISVLELDKEDFDKRPVSVHAPHSASQLSQSARLRSAHATYGLTSLAEMKRVGVGAWIHRKYA